MIAAVAFMRRIFRFLLCLLLAAGIVLAGCGGSSDGDAKHPDGPATFGTLAWAVTDCRSDGETVTVRQDLHVGAEDRPQATVTSLQIGPLDAQTPVIFPFSTIPPQPVGLAEACRLLGQVRLGTHSVFFLFIQDVEVSPDGETIVYEVTDNFSPLPPGLLDAADEGIFAARADGTDIRRISDARTLPSFVLEAALSVDAFAFSPDGETVAFVDGFAGIASVNAELVTLDLSDGARRVVVELPAGPPAERFPPTCCPRFVDDDTIAFTSTANPDGLNPGGEFALFTVDTDGSDLAIALSTLPAATVSPLFAITGMQPAVTILEIPGPSGGAVAPEIFFFDEEQNLLQLTNFRRQDTLSVLLDIGGETVFYLASADPLGTNPSRNCQLFAVPTIGGTPRQLTDFGEAPQSTFGCLFSPLPGCAIGGMFQDPDTGTLVFHSSCDPLGTNPFGDAIFAMRPDGSGLRQLTFTRGLVDENGIQIVEVPGPSGYRVAAN